MQRILQHSHLTIIQANQIRATAIPAIRQVQVALHQPEQLPVIPVETTGSSNSNTNASNNNAAPAHEHKWVLHEGSGHYETQVVKEAWDEPVYEMREITRCSTCNADISSWSEEQIGDHIEAHILAGEDKGGYYSTGERVQTGTKHHDAETKQVWVQDVAPYAQCSGCGEIGPVGSGISIN